MSASTESPTISYLDALERVIDVVVAPVAVEIDWIGDFRGAFVTDGTLVAGQLHIVAEPEPFDHCNFTVGPSAPTALVARFHDLLPGMSFDDSNVRPLMELEGLTVSLKGRVEGYRDLDTAMDQAGFYDQRGTITAGNYPY